jgi:hypothetical protein
MVPLGEEEPIMAQPIRAIIWPNMPSTILRDHCHIPPNAMDHRCRPTKQEAKVPTIKLQKWLEILFF